MFKFVKLKKAEKQKHTFSQIAIYTNYNAVETCTFNQTIIHNVAELNIKIVLTHKASASLSSKRKKERKELSSLIGLARVWSLCRVWLGVARST